MLYQSKEIWEKPGSNAVSDRLCLGLFGAVFVNTCDLAKNSPVVKRPALEPDRRFDPGSNV